MGVWLKAKIYCFSASLLCATGVQPGRGGRGQIFGWFKGTYFMDGPQSDLDLHLQLNSTFLLKFITFLLCVDITDAIITIQIQLHFNTFLLKILHRRFSFEKNIFASFKNIFRRFAFMFQENGRFYYIIFPLVWDGRINYVLSVDQANINPTSSKCFWVHRNQ